MTAKPRRRPGGEPAWFGATLGKARALLARHHIDSTIIFGAGRMAWMSASGLVTIVFVARFLTGVEQGYFYTFFAFFQLQTAFQAGAYVALYAAISHAYARVHLDAEGRIMGEPADLAHLGGLLRLSRVWHVGCAILFALLLGPLGYVFFSFEGSGPVPWQGAWWLLSLAISSSFLILPDSLALEATGRTGIQQRALFCGQVLSSLCILAGLALHMGLYVVASGTIIRLVVTGLMQRGHTGALHGLPAGPVKWREEILPQQSKLTVSWLLGYAIFVSAVPITFRAAGPVVAGRLGVALQIYQAVSATAGVWITRAQPHMGRLAGRGAYGELRHLTWTTGLRGAFSALFLGLGALGLVAAIQAFLPNLAPRMPGFAALELFMVAAVAAQIPSAMAAAVRLTRAEPFIPLTAVSAGLTVAIYAVASPVLGEAGSALGFAAVALLVLFPGQVFIYHRRIAAQPDRPQSEVVTSARSTDG